VTRATRRAALALSIGAVLLIGVRETRAADGVTAITGARIVTVSGPVIERGTVVISGGKIAALGADVAVPPGATVIDGSGQTVYPGLIDGLTTLGLTEIGSVAGSVDVAETGDVNPHARAWIAVNPHSELLPVARANGITAALAAPTGGLVSGQSALIRMAGSTPDALTLKTPAAMHVVYPSGRAPADPSRSSDEPDLKTFEERQKEKKKNQEKDLRRLANLLEEARAYGELLRSGPAAKPDLPMESLAPVARGEVPMVVRADAEDDIRGAVAFATEHALKLIIAGGLEAWRCADVLKQRDVPVLMNVERLPRRESDPYDAAYANAAKLQAAGVRFAIVSDDASQSRNLPYEAAMARAYGLPAAAALRAITLSPAEIFGVAERVGSLAVGKDADLFMATGDIMDPRVSVTHVFIDGVPQSLETRHTRLYQQFKDRP
jgi:imidazolonepropionase-like amidohydrolase